STSGIVDDHFFSALSQATGTAKLKVTGTETYTTDAGSTKTVFVLEGVGLNAAATKSATNEKIITRALKEDSISAVYHHPGPTGLKITIAAAISGLLFLVIRFVLGFHYRREPVAR